MNSEEIKAKVNRFLVELTEQVPDLHVQVLMSWNTEGQTRSLHTGMGNWYARQGLAHEFINADVAQENAQQIADAIRPPEEGAA